MEQILYWAAAIAVIGGAGTMLWRAITAGLRTGRKWDMFLEDWHGTPERPGRPAVPGVMERLVQLEQGLQEVRHEMFPNSGGSLRDVVDRLERQASDLVATIPSPRPSAEQTWPTNSATVPASRA